MTRLWRLLAIAAALNMTAGAASAAAQTVLVRKAPPGMAVEALLNDVVTASGTLLHVRGPVSIRRDDEVHVRVPPERVLVYPAE